ncbi:fungal Zn(2)-cys(6) binuclear cluster domain protein [Rhizoctonia solani 123E]|uniref:Fungal Zn(2)-cys(6) binuclear cluster domain protein n=1 Tax=Rhizoctonia solani 123E TaxID=1423351 RepID=A0A074RRP9_9AGAM|nr:fungal Zn(2)-cys(6) binuclear cluster domain protein [Rhizoctonia solani 123E]
MIATKSKPGPRRTSCLTCRKRRKRCDLSRPACERCLKGGHECLGYEHSESHKGTQEEDLNIPVLQSHPAPTTVLVSAIDSEKVLPVFLLLVAAHSNLHVEQPSGNLVISFPHTFGAPQYELKWFVMYDAITSLLLGVQPMVEYGYNSECDSASHGLEWIHGIPFVLFETISQVNSWRAGSRAAPLDNWRNLETRVLAWQSPLTVTEPQESGANIAARLAIQEGWRHVTLIYIYMGMCGVSSHDQRVQTSIMHIMQLGEAVNDLPIGVHVFVHCVVVGLAARYERHRCIVHEKLLSFKGTRVWLFHGVEFGRILEHLWYGVGAGGGPVTWDDYVRSRCAVVPM